MSRTAIALCLTLLAIALPCAAWYVVGSREATREAEALAREEVARARALALPVAERLAARLEALRASESRRPFYHYQSLYHDPRGASEGISVTPSPLSLGPADPLIRAHFQIDGSGKLSLPTLNEEVCDLNAPESVVTQQPILQELEAAARGWWQAVKERPTQVVTTAYGQKRVMGADAVASAAEAAAAPLPPKLELLNQTAFYQNVQASKLYQDLKSGGKVSGTDPAYAMLEATNVIIQLGDFQWRTVSVGRAPSLVALREVVTPAGVLTQGFQIAPAAVAQSLAGLPFAVKFLPGTAESETDLVVPLSGEGWRLHLALAAPASAAKARAAHALRRFRRDFLAGTAIAVVAGLFVVGIVWQAERLATQRSRFAASAAHELRTPLAGLRMYGDMLADGLGDPARAPQYARRIADEAERLGRVVGNVLGFTRLERGTLKVRPEAGDLGAAVRRSVDHLRPALESAGARVEVAIADGLPSVRFDTDTVQQILQNLTDNAEKYTRDSADRTIHVELYRNGAGVALSVRDRGPGVPAHIRRRLFRPFTRGDGRGMPAGMGLGLVLVRALAEAQGARASHADAPGGGSQFSVIFPT